MNQKTKRLLYISGGVLLLVLLALPKLLADDAETAAAPVQQQDNRLAVRAYIVAADQLVDKIYATGTILANEEVELRTEVAGRVEAIHFTEGRTVERGAVLVSLNDDDLQARLQQAQFRLKLAQDRAARQQSLLEKGGVSQEELEATQNEVNVLEAEEQLIRVQIEKMKIRAPFSGVVGLRGVSEGSYLSSATPVATLKDLDPVKVEFSIPERFAQRVALGDEIVFRVEGLDQPFRGAIYALEPQIDQATRTLRLRARSDNPGGRLLPGAFADIELIFEEINDAVTVPSIAVIPELGGKKVYIVENGMAASRQVETGIRTEDRVQIIHGLAPGDTVIVTGIQQLRAGLPVRLTDVGGGVLEDPAG